MNYGLPYKGSKSKIAPWIVELLPGSERLYDLFAGGCAITHAAMLTGKWDYYVVNDIDVAPRLFCDAVAGQYHNERRWISREDFFAMKDSDPYIRYCWSFGNNGMDYLYSTKIEPYKRACHYAVVQDDWAALEVLCPEVADAAREALYGISHLKQRRLAFGPAIVRRLNEIGDTSLIYDNPLYRSCRVRRENKSRPVGAISDIKRLERLQSLERLERLESLERLQSLERLERLQSDYREIEIIPGSTVYCDIPYNNTSGYSTAFDHQAFYDWCQTRNFPVYVSEYWMPKGFTCIAAKEKTSCLNAKTSFNVTEKLFVQSRFA